MQVRRSLIWVIAAVVGCGVLGSTALTGAAGTASAEPVNRTAVTPPGYTLANGLCAGVVRMLASPTTVHPGRTYIQVVGGFTGISGDAAPCRVLVSVDWRNLRTGSAGTVTGWVAGIQIPFAPTRVLQREVATGTGVVELRLRPHHVHRPVGPIRVTVG